MRSIVMKNLNKIAQDGVLMGAGLDPGQSGIFNIDSI
jgi:hypothetical protein